MTAPSQDDLKHLASRIWAPALAGAVGGGGLSGYLSSEADNPDETSSQRRMRILRNALAGTAMGVVAGAATEEGARALYQPFFGDTDKKPALVDRGIGASLGSGAKHLAGIGALAGGASWINRSRSAHQSTARQKILTHLGGSVDLPTSYDDEGEAKMRTMALSKDDPKNNTLKEVLEAQPTHVKTLEGKLMANSENIVNKNPDFPAGLNKSTETIQSLHEARDLLNEAGVKNEEDPTLPQLAKQVLFGKRHRGEAPTLVNREGKMVDVTPARKALTDSELGLKTFLGRQGFISRGVSSLVGKKPTATVPRSLRSILNKIPGTEGLDGHAVDMGKVPELYRRLVRPSMKGRLNMPAQLALLGAGAYGIDRIQKRVMGQ